MLFTKKQPTEESTVTQVIVEPVPAKHRVRIEEIRPGIDTFAKIKVVGVGGSGGSAINRMVEANIHGVEFLAINTDAQALKQSKATNKLHIGKTATRGLGAGMNPALGRAAAEESLAEIKERLADADMVFITCGLGGGTGTGAAPIIADIAKRDIGALTVAVVTRPFAFEGAQRRVIADQGHAELAERVDAIVTIPNDRLLQIIDKKTSLLEAFSLADEILKQGVQGISDLITVPGLINLDFADVKAIMEGAGSALMGIGRGSGENRAVDAAKAAIDSPLLEISIDGAKGILFAITGGPDLGMHEISEAAQVITKSSDPNAKIVFGAIIDEKMGDEVKVTVVATGFAGDDIAFGNLGSRRPERGAPAPVERVDEALDNAVQLKEKNQNRFTAFRHKPSTPTVDNSVKDDELEIPAFIRKKMMEEEK